MQTLASVKEKSGLIQGEIDIEIQMGRARAVVCQESVLALLLLPRRTAYLKVERYALRIN